MKIHLYDQVRNPAFPLKCVNHYTGSALPVELTGVPFFYGGASVTGVRLTLTNADGVPVTAVCEKLGYDWHTLFAASNFAHYGFVSKGVKVELTLAGADGTEHQTLIAVGDFEIHAAAAGVQPGDPSAHYATKDGDHFEKIDVRDGVQHYIKRVMVFDPDPAIGWGAKWEGDYILTSDGNFIPANQEA